MFVEDGFKILQTEKESSSVIKHFSSEIKVERIPVEKIVPNPYQPRKDFEEDALDDLAASIAEYGVLQPLLVARSDNDEYVLIAGERRLRASKLAGLKDVPVIVSNYTKQQSAEIALIENLQREDLHYLEEAEGYEKLMTQFNLTQEAMAVVKRLTRRIVAPLREGSNPSSHPIFLGRSQVGKARDFDSRMRWFESSRPSQIT